jgi:hypothetical protein
MRSYPALFTVILEKRQDTLFGKKYDPGAFEAEWNLMHSEQKRSQDAFELPALLIGTTVYVRMEFYHKLTLNGEAPVPHVKVMLCNSSQRKIGDLISFRGTMMP